MKVKTRQSLLALVGNPNSGKTSVFNRLTGLHQKTGNFPGVTVERKYAEVRVCDKKCELVDLPGTYSLFPTSEEEKVVVEQLLGVGDFEIPDGIIYVADTTQFEKHLLLFTQILDLGIPSILVCNMQDEAEKKTISLDVQRLEKKLGVPVISVSARTGQGFEDLNNAISSFIDEKNIRHKPVFTNKENYRELIDGIKELTGIEQSYRAWLVAHHYKDLPSIDQGTKNQISELLRKYGFIPLKEEVYEVTARYQFIEPLIRQVLVIKSDNTHPLTDKMDRWFTDRWVGPLIFIGILLLIFQAIFTLASYPMDAIDLLFATAGEWVKTIFPNSWYGDLLADGILAGLGGVVIFIPQIAILFFLISILEETGYMARAVYLFDGLMQRFGLNGRSVVALVSGGACAIPAIMTARTIANAKERLITILVTPFISCSARIPIYTVLVAFLVPSVNVLGIFNLQGLVFSGLYIVSVLTALIAAFILSRVFQSQGSSFLMMELPEYKVPVWRNVMLTTYEKVKSFIVEAGKIILGISIVLWFLASYGPGERMKMAEQNAQSQAIEQKLDAEEAENLLASKKLEESYAGIIGKTMEPVIRPLGYDWKIGIALVTSFAAREVFISTISTIYAIGSDSDDRTIKARMSEELNPVTQRPRYDFPTTLSLLVFYMFAMQCMSTLAVVRKETGAWKWPIIQFLAMTLLAYFSALIVYQILS